MQNIVSESLTRNGNGSGAIINARGIPRRGWTPEQRISAAADAALGATHVVPSIKQAAAAFGVSAYMVRQELKARAAAKEAAAERERQAEYARQGALPIVSAWDHATAQGRAEAIRLIGVGDVWDVLASIVG